VCGTRVCGRSAFRMLTQADVGWRRLTYADRRPALPRLLQDLRRPTHYSTDVLLAIVFFFNMSFFYKRCHVVSMNSWEVSWNDGKGHNAKKKYTTSTCVVERRYCQVTLVKFHSFDSFSSWRKGISVRCCGFPGGNSWNIEKDRKRRGVYYWIRYVTVPPWW